VSDDAMLRLAAADAAASVNWTACLRLASAAVPRIRRSHLRERAVSTVAFARAQPQDGVPTTTTRVRSLGTPIVHAGVFRCVTVTVEETTVRLYKTDGSGDVDDDEVVSMKKITKTNTGKRNIAETQTAA